MNFSKQEKIADLEERMCIYLVCRPPQRYAKPDGIGDCTTCKYDKEKNQQCVGYYGVVAKEQTTHLIHT